MQKVVLNLATAERPMLSHVFPGPDIGAVLENPSLASTEKQVDFDACHWLALLVLVLPKLDWVHLKVSL